MSGESFCSHTCADSGARRRHGVLRVHLCRDKKAGGREQRTARSIRLVLFAGSLLGGSLQKEILPR